MSGRHYKPPPPEEKEKDMSFPVVLPDELTNALNDAFQSLYTNDIRNMWSDYVDNIDESYRDSLERVLSSFDAEEWCEDMSEYDDAREFYGAIVSEFTEELGNDLEESEQWSGSIHEWVDGMCIYTSNNNEYFNANESECDSMLGDIDISSCGSVSEIITRVVYSARHAEASSEFYDIVNDLQSGNYDETVLNYLV